MNGNYWAERERTKAAALKMAANLAAREKGLAVTAATRGLINDAAHDQTHQRKFERGFRSIDQPDEDGNLYDYSDCGRDMRRMLRALDALYWECVRELRFAAALECVPEPWRKMLEMIRDRIPRRTIMRRCRISRATYFRRIEAMRQMVEAFWQAFELRTRRGILISVPPCEKNQRNGQRGVLTRSLGEHPRSL